MVRRALSAMVVAVILLGTGGPAIASAADSDASGASASAVETAVTAAGDPLPVETAAISTDWCTANPNTYVALQQLTSNPSVVTPERPARANISLWLQRVNRNEGQSSPAGLASRATLDAALDGVGYRSIVSDLQLTAHVPTGWPVGSYITDTGNTQGVNALGITDDGIAYLVYQYMAYQAWTTGPSYHFFADVLSIDLKDPTAEPRRIAQHYLLDRQSTTSGYFPIVSAGAINPVDGDFYFGEHRIIAQGAEAGQTALTIHRVDTGSGHIGAVAESRLSAATASALGLTASTSAQETASNTRLAWGDFDFNGQGDLTYTVPGSDQMLLPTIPAELLADLQTESITVIAESDLVIPTRQDGSRATHGLHAIEGFANLDNGLGVFADRQTGATGTITATSRQFLRHGPAWVNGNQPLNGRDYTFTPASSFDASSGLRDLASCSSRAPITVELDLSRVVLEDDQRIAVTVDGADAGSRGTWIVDAADAAGQESMRRTLATAAQESTATMRVALSTGEVLGVRHSCTNDALAQRDPFHTFASGATESGEFTLRVPVAATQNTLPTNWGHTPQLTCTLMPFRPALTVEQVVVDVASGDPVPAGHPLGAEGLYRYDTAFGNLDGETVTQVDHILWLTDVCDDVLSDGPAEQWLADLCTGSSTVIPTSAVSRPAGFTVDPVPGGLRVRGTVRAGGEPADHTVSFAVRVRSNADSADERRTDSEASPQRGYTLRTFVTTHTDDAVMPAECIADASHRTACTDHPVLAWAVEKASRPQDGAVVHAGGYIHYTLTVTKLGLLDHEVGGIRLQDDMTQVLRAARMDPDAPTSGGQYDIGIRTFGLDGTTPLRTLTPGDGLPADGLLPKSATASGTLSDPEWTMDVPVFDLLPGEHRAVVAYAVRVGGAADPVDPTRFQMDAGGHVVAPAPNLSFTNTVVAHAAQSFPTSCDVREPDASDQACAVSHRLGDTRFHVQKNSSRSTADEPVENLPVEFVLGDASGGEGEWSRWICRTDNFVSTDGSQAQPAGSQTGNAGVQPGVDAWAGEAHSGAEILHSIRAWNSVLAEDDRQRKADCGLFYRHDVHADADAGTWHGEAVAPGDYLLWETQASPGHQRLTEPIAFTVGAHDPAPAGLSPQDADLYDHGGRLALPSVDSGWFTDDGRQIALTCDAVGGQSTPPSNGEPACVTNAGWLLQVYSPATLRLPLSGAESRWNLGLAAVGLAAVLAVVWWRRRRHAAETSVR